jgi:hypothetical protein
METTVYPSIALRIIIATTPARSAPSAIRIPIGFALIDSLCEVCLDQVVVERAKMARQFLALILADRIFEHLLVSCLKGVPVERRSLFKSNQSRQPRGNCDNSRSQRLESIACLGFEMLFEECLRKASKDPGGNRRLRFLQIAPDAGQRQRLRFVSIFRLGTQLLPQTGQPDGTGSCCLPQTSSAHSRVGQERFGWRGNTSLHIKKPNLSVCREITYVSFLVCQPTSLRWNQGD